MRIAVTGSTGHLGANLVRELLAHGLTVRALYLQETELNALGELEVERIQADVLDPDGLRAAFAGADAVIHLAGLISIAGDPSGIVMKTNVLGTRNVARACLETGVKRLVHMSSVHAFVSPGPGGFMNEETRRPGPTHFIYDQSKAQGEAEIRAATEHGLDAIILNPTGILGPHDYNASFGGRMINGLFDGSHPALVMAGFDWVDARDVAAAARAALTKGRVGENYLLPGHWISMKDLAGLCKAVSGVKPPGISLPIWVARAGLPFVSIFSKLAGIRPVYTAEALSILQESCRNISGGKARRELGFAARPLAETITDTHRWRQESFDMQQQA